ncbi:MAG: hypothetical protein ACRDGN_18530, partial [bacterium]
MRSAVAFLLGAICGTLLIVLLAPYLLPNRAATTGPRAQDGGRQIGDATLLKESQDRYLEILATTPNHRGAMRGLIFVRRQLARDDPAVLRRQAAAYRQAIATGVVVQDEYYTTHAMASLAQASLQAATELEGKKSPLAAAIVLKAGPAPVAQTIARGPTPPRLQPPSPRSVLPRDPPKRIIGSARTPRRQPRLVQTVESPDLDERRGPRYRIQVGPVFSLEDANAVTAVLRQAGFAPQISKSAATATAFQVMSEVVSRRVGERRAVTLADLGFRTQMRAVSTDRIQLYFGTFVSKGNAEDLARRIRATGYWVAVVGGGAHAYVITLGPHGQPTVDAITGVFMARSRITYPV